MFFNKSKLLIYLSIAVLISGVLLGMSMGKLGIIYIVYAVIAAAVIYALGNIMFYQEIQISLLKEIISKQDNK